MPVWITNFRATASQVSGPVKIVEMGAQLSEQGGSGLVLFMALISINLAVLNALPVPLLDGGQMLLLGIEAVLGRPVSERLQLAYAQSGFLLIVGPDRGVDRAGHQPAVRGAAADGNR